MGKKMQLMGLGLLAGFMAATTYTQTPAPTTPGQGVRVADGLMQAPDDGRALPLIGKIAAISKGSIALTKLDGSTETIKVTDKTEYRRDRQAAKLSDFKVGDMVFVRGDENPDHSVTAQMIGGRSGGSQGGRGFGPGGGAGFGELGKDFVVGEVKSVDAPSLTVLRSDNVTQTLEFTEETSLRRGRDSITMADIQPGDHVVIRGAVQNHAFVPKNVMVLSAEQWQRMEEIRKANGVGPDGKSLNGTKPAPAPASNPPQS